MIRIKMKKEKDRKGLWRDTRCVSIAFSVFIMFTVIITFAIISLGISPVIQETVKFNNEYMEQNQEKYLPEVRQNQDSAYMFYDYFVIIMILTLASWMIVNAIKREWDSTGGG